jgi:hypothetical protein
VKFSVPVNSSGDYSFFTINMFSDLEKNPFVSDTRQTDIDYGYNQNYIIVGHVQIPDGYEFEQPPKNITMIMPDTSIVFKRVSEVKDKKISFRVTLDFKRPVYSHEEYQALKEFYKEFYARLNEQIVFRKKA